MSPRQVRKHNADGIIDLFAAGYYEGRLDDEIFAGLWDNLPGLEALGGHPHPLPAEGPQGYGLAYRVPPAVMNPPLEARAQAGPGQIQLPAAPARPHNQWDMEGLEPLINPGGLQLRPPRVANLANMAPLAPPLHDNQPVVDPWQLFQQLQDNDANIQQFGRIIPRIPPQADMRPHLLAREARQHMLRAMDGRIAQHARDENQIPDGAIPAQPGVPNRVASGRVRKNVDRGAAHPLNPPNRQA